MLKKPGVKMSNAPDANYSDFHVRLLENLVDLIKIQPPFSNEYPDADDSAFLESLKQLVEQPRNDDYLADGQQLLCKIVAAYPHLMPILPRDLLWFFGGDCLHYMPDDEIGKFQMLDEKRQQAIENGEDFSYQDERAKIFGLH